MRVRPLGQEDPLEEGSATHSRILAWRILWTEEAGGLQSVGLQSVSPNWSNWACRVIESADVALIIPCSSEVGPGIQLSKAPELLQMRSQGWENHCSDQFPNWGSLDRQHQHHLGTCLKMQVPRGPTPDGLGQTFFCDVTWVHQGRYIRHSYKLPCCLICDFL